MASLGHTGRRKVVLGHTLNIQTLAKTDEQKKVLGKFMVLCGAAFIAILGRMRPTGLRLDTPRSLVALGLCTAYPSPYLPLSGLQVQEPGVCR